MTLDDSDLMRRVQEGDFHLFEILVGRYQSALIRVACGMLGDAALAEDVVQEAFLAVFAARQTYKPDLPFRTWLWTILLNRCRQVGARRVRCPQEVARSTIDKFGPPAREPAIPDTVSAPLLAQERRDQLERYLRELPDAQADAIRLRFFAGLTYDEIAHTMGISLGGAKLRVRSALERLSQRLRGNEESCDEL